MNITKLLTVIGFAFALAAGPVVAADTHAACCEKSKAKGEECAHKCCVDAKKANTVCEKCGGKKEEKKTT